MAQAATAAGVSTRTGYRVLAGYRAEGRAGFEDRGSAPQRRPGRTRPRPRLEQWIIALRARRLSGPATAHRTGLPRATVGHVLRRHGFGRLPPLRPKPPVQRYERSRPGELVHIDTKALGRIAGVGHRRVRGIGWDHVHVCIDDATRVAYREVLATNQQHDAVAFLARAQAWFEAQGVRVEQVMTDNGSAYRSRLWRAAGAAGGLRHLRTRPYTPRTKWQSGALHTDAAGEWAYANRTPPSARRRHALVAWQRYYNQRRPHTALANRALLTRLQRPRREQRTEQRHLGAPRCGRARRTDRWRPSRRRASSCSARAPARARLA